MPSLRRVRETPSSADARAVSAASYLSLATLLLRGFMAATIVDRPWLLALVANGLLTPAVLALLRRRGPDAAFDLLAAGTSAVLFAQSLLGRPYDWTFAAWIFTLPPLALYYGGQRALLRQTALSVGVVVLSLLFHARGLTLDRPFPNPEAAQATRVVVLLTVSVLVGVMWERERAEALAELARARDRAEAESRARGAFLAMMSHSLRMPMNGVLGVVEQLRESPLDVAQRARVALVQRSGATLVAILNDIRDFSLAEAGRLEIVDAPYDLHTAIDDVGALLRARAESVAIHVDRDASVPRWVVGDALRVRQVLHNLVGNALRDTERGEVRLVARARDGRLRLSVRDTGHGVDAHTLAHVFEAFAPNLESAGLGLVIAKQLVALMGGAITATSEPGVGSTFTVELPLTLAPSPVAVERASSPDLSPSATAAPVLVVDDNPVNRLVAGSLVERAGFRVEYARNGAEAVSRIAEGDDTLVLMDCHMPVMDGFEAIARVRELRPPRRATRIVALTASEAREDLDACLRSGMNACITKPVAPEALRDALREALAAREQRATHA